ncbi:predicted protein [Histoplasma capsulatum H143]|uniref:Uncharacterized protein n=1 Tax=Ajellomyces capsulatus (strain H143) TaxID=544712 RepID=C6HPN9_AJECH|nr:predicted protein [Histoplasma capsulatum H143]
MVLGTKEPRAEQKSTGTAQANAGAVTDPECDRSYMIDGRTTKNGPSACCFLNPVARRHQHNRHRKYLRTKNETDRRVSALTKFPCWQLPNDSYYLMDKSVLIFATIPDLLEQNSVAGVGDTQSEVCFCRKTRHGDPKLWLLHTRDFKVHSLQASEPCDVIGTSTIYRFRNSRR